MTKRWLAAVLCVCFAMLQGPALRAESAAGSAVAIVDRAGLEAIADDPGGRYVLQADIDLRDDPWMPIEFSGILDGNGHTIYNVRIREPNPAPHTTVDGNHIAYDTLGAGLFSYAKGATLKDLHLLNVDLAVSVDAHVFAAALVGIADGTAISGCTVEAGRIDVTTPKKMFGAGGLVGFGSGSITDCATDVLTVLVDTNPDERCEAFMGGLLACGQADLVRDAVTTTGYASLTGYMHTGGIVGMFHKSVHGDPKLLVLRDCTVSATERYFEDNPDPRGYCYAVYGEIPTSDTRLVTGNAVVSFEKHRAEDTSRALRPEKDADPVYASVVTPPTCTAYGFTTYTCTACGYAYTDDYVHPAHAPGPWTVVREATYAAPGLKRITCTIDGVLLQEEEIPRLVFLSTVELTTGSVAPLATLLPEGSPSEGLVWSSSDETIATVTATGIVTCAGFGAAFVSCSTPDGFAFARFTVVDRIRATLQETYRGTLRLSSLLPKDASSLGLVWSTSDPAVAAIEDGSVRFAGRGSAVLSCATAGGATVAEYTVDVSYAWWQWLVVILLFGWIWY